jgi:hypothetical protein
LGAASAEVVSVSGGDIPAEADLAIVWYLPDDRDFDEYVTAGGSLANGTFLVSPPTPIPDVVISERYGVATGLVLAYPKGEVPEPGPFTALDMTGVDYFVNAIGVVNNHAIIYRHASPDPVLFPPSVEWWGNRFDDGYNCGRANQQEGEFDQFEPVDCASMVLRFGVVSEIEIVGGDWF